MKNHLLKTRIKKYLLFTLLLIGISVNYGCQESNGNENINKNNLLPNRPSKVSLWVTTADESILFEKQDSILKFLKAKNEHPVIKIDPEKSYQSIDGFGFTLTGGSAMHLYKMDAQKREAILKELFATDSKNIGTSYLRVSIGASDLDEKPFSYNDLPVGETDYNMEKFSLDPDRKYLIPVLKEILAINPKLKIMGSPWSPPVWMKTNGDTRGGSLKPDAYAAYALYFVKYIKEMAGEGITIDAITVQNEPLHPGNNPSLLMLPEDQAIFIKDHVGPAFKEAKITTKIILYDHNADRPDYPISILNDPEARKYVDGSAFHLYGGTIDALTEVHEAHPDKHIYFTEQWIGAPGNFPENLSWHVKHLIIGATRNWSRTVLEWNLAADPNQDPHTDRGGCDRCLGAITIDGNKVIRNPAYYIIGHAAKFVRPESIRIESNLLESLPNVAFKTPQGKIVLIILNETPTKKTFNIQFDGHYLTTSLPGGAVGTYTW